MFADTHTDRTRDFQCPVCRVVLTVRQHNHGAAWLPAPEDRLSSEGWSRTATLAGGKQRIPLQNGQTGLVDVAARVVPLDRWCCGAGCAATYATRIERNTVQHSVDRPRPGTEPSQPAPMSLEDRRPETTLTCSRAGCTDSLTVPADATRRLAFLDAHGWQLIVGRWWCGRRCHAIHTVLTRPEAAPVTPGPSHAEMLALRRREAEGRARAQRGELPPQPAPEPPPERSVPARRGKREAT